MICVLINSNSKQSIITNAIHSVVSQGPLVRELILIGNTSSSETLNLVEEKVKSSGRIVHVVRSEKGFSVALNSAFDLITQQWVAILDSDSSFASDRLRTLLAKCELDKVDFCFSGIDFDFEGCSADEDTTRDLMADYGAATSALTNLSPGEVITKLNPIVTMSNLFFRRKVWDIVGGFTHRLLTAEWDFALNALLDSRIKSAFYREKLLVHRLEANKVLHCSKMRFCVSKLSMLRKAQLRFPANYQNLDLHRRRVERQLRKETINSVGLITTHPESIETPRSHFPSFDGEDSLRRSLAFVAPVSTRVGELRSYLIAVILQLTRSYQLTLVSDFEDTGNQWLDTHVPRRASNWFSEHGGQFDRVVYVIGNAPVFTTALRLLPKYPGLVVMPEIELLDLHLHLMKSTQNASLAAREIFRACGAWAIAKENVLSGSDILRARPLALTGEVLRQSLGLLVHSNRAKRALETTFDGLALDRQILVSPSVSRRIGDTIKSIGDEKINRLFLRQQLGIQGNSFIVCAFGRLNKSTLDTLIQCWNSWVSTLSTTPPMQFVLVGGYDALSDPSWVNSVKSAIASHNTAYPFAPVRVTGWTGDKQYEEWLVSADVAVQVLGERELGPSIGLLDALCWGLPVATNQEARQVLGIDFLGELPRDPHSLEFSKEFSRLMSSWQQSAALRDELGAKALSWAIQGKHNREARVGFKHAIEKSHQVAALLQRKSRPRVSSTIWIDIGAMGVRDSATGIQRVSRSVIRFLLSKQTQFNNLSQYRIELVNVDSSGLTQALRYTERFLSVENGTLGHERIVSPQSGDIVLFLEVNYGLCEHQNMVSAWKKNNVGLVCFVHDLLPVTHPHWFPEGNSFKFHQALNVISKESDLVLTNSRHTMDQFLLHTNFSSMARVVTLGCDLESSVPSHGANTLTKATVEQINSQRGFKVLMVGTVEPRKGHDEVLKAFEQIWSESVSDVSLKGNIHLIILGKQGWMVEDVCRRIRSHPLYGQFLWWIDDASDEVLKGFYRRCDLLLMASHGEGFGLPIVEAAGIGLPVLARDIPIFREVSHCADVTWFSNTEELVSSLNGMKDIITGSFRREKNAKPLATWAQTGAEVFQSLEHVAQTINRSVGLDTSRSRID